MSYVGRTRDEERRMLRRDRRAPRFEDAARGGARRRCGCDRPLASPGRCREIELRRRFGALGRARTTRATRGRRSSAAGCYDHYIPAAVNALAHALRVRHRVHAVPARGRAGHADRDLRVPEHDRRADRHGGRERLAVRRRHRRRRGGAAGAPPDRPLARRGRRRAASALPRRAAHLSRRTADLTLVADRGGQCAPEDLQRRSGADVACVVYQYPNFFGLLESPHALHRARARAPARSRSRCCDPIALALLEPPGAARDGAERICGGRGAALGNPPSFGGPAARVLRVPPGARAPHAGPHRGRDRGPRRHAAASCSRCRRASSTSAARRRRRTSAPTRA